MMENYKAIVLVIGDEILSGKIQDLNVKFIAEELSSLGITLSEVRIIPDDKLSIINNINELKSKYSFVFTTGGIGPTHDDITSISIAEALNLKIEYNKEALKIIIDRYKTMGQETPESSKNMALMPKGAEIIINTETGAPGFHIENIYVMAGIPWVMQAMFQEVKKILENLPGIGLPFITKSIDVFIGESIIARSLEELQQRYPQVTIGSYPYIESNRWGTTLSIRSKDEKSIDSALKELEKILEGLTE